MQCGYVIPVMERIDKWVLKIDQSLIRYFILQVLTFYNLY